MKHLCLWARAQRLLSGGKENQNYVGQLFPGPSQSSASPQCLCKYQAFILGSNSSIKSMNFVILPNYFTPLCLSVLICKIGLLGPTSQY
jgi:hypothetical protein